MIEGKIFTAITEEELDKIYKMISKNVKYYRLFNKSKYADENGKISQEKLAELSNYSVGFIMNIESEKYYQTFSLGTLWQFGKALNVDIREFFRPLD